MSTSGTRSVEAILTLVRARQTYRERLLGAAQALFLQAGYYGTTMERIAAAAGASKVTLYKYFGDKDALLLALVREGHIAPAPALVAQTHAMVEHARRTLEGGNDDDAIYDTVLALLRGAAERCNDAFFRLLIEVALDQPGLAARLKRAAFGADGENIWLGLGRSLASRLPCETDPEVLGQLLFATVIGYTVVQPVILGEHRVSPERLAEGLVALLQGTPRSRRRAR